MNDRIKKRVSYVINNDIYPLPVTVQYDEKDNLLSEPEKIGKRLFEYINAQIVAIDDNNLLTGQIRFDGTVPSDLFHRTGHKAFMKYASQYYCVPQENIVTFEWQHSSPDYSFIINNGLVGYRKKIKESIEKHKGDKKAIEFLNGLMITVDALSNWAKKCAKACLDASKTTKDEKRKLELLKMHDVLSNVPENPAHTFYEAIQSLYICFDCLPDGIGTIDRYFYKFYKHDIENNIINRENAKELLQELFIRLQSATQIGNANRTKGGECHFAIGGYLPDGSDGFNDLSKLIVESLMELPLDIPEISLRWTKKTKREVLEFMLDMERKDVHKRIAFVNDEPRIVSFMNNLGLSYEDAVKYTMVGCNEPAFPGSVWYGGATSNFAKVITDLFDKYKEEICKTKTFDEFYIYVEKSINNWANKVFEYVNKFNLLRAEDINVLSSLFLDGCIESAKSATQGGCRVRMGGTNLMGLITTIDSLAIINQFVFEEKKITMNVLIDAVKNNWQGYEKLHLDIIINGHFFGNNYDDVDDIASKVTTTLYNFTKDKKLVFDTNILLGTLTGYNPHYAWFGKTTGATPDGRYLGDPISLGTAQTEGKDKEGITALFTSISKFDPNGIFCGPNVTNVRLDESLVKNENNFKKLVIMVETYFKLGGLHVQFNYVSKEELLKAKKNPENYKNLKVRVSGFSGFFTTLEEEIQDNVIARTEISK